MLFHMSIDAREPAHVAAVIAEMWDGEALPFPPVSDAAWIAMADDCRGSAIEVYPAGTGLAEADGDADAVGVAGVQPARSPSHVAIATMFDQDAILAIARREGWPAKYRKRGDMFGVIEMWIEGRQMIEVLTPEMQIEYRRTMTIAGWKQLLASAPLVA